MAIDDSQSSLVALRPRQLVRPLPSLPTRRTSTDVVDVAAQKRTLVSRSDSRRIQPARWTDSCPPRIRSAPCPASGPSPPTAPISSASWRSFPTLQCVRAITRSTPSFSRRCLDRRMVVSVMETCLKCGGNDGMVAIQSLATRGRGDVRPRRETRLFGLRRDD